jgi:hypothetical protein
MLQQLADMAQILINRDQIVKGTLPHVCVRCGEVAVTNRFPGLGNPSITSWFLSARLRVFGMLLFWAYILKIALSGNESETPPAGLPLCERHRNYWPRRAWFMVVGFLGLIGLWALSYATDPSVHETGHRITKAPNFVSVLFIIWFFIYLPGFLIVHLSSMRLIGNEGMKTILSGGSQKFAAALRAAEQQDGLSPTATDDKLTIKQQFKRVAGDYFG